MGGAVVSDHLKVDPIDLRMSSDHLDMHHAELRAAHSAADSAIEGAQVGWVGASAAALHAKMTDWQAATTHLTDDIAAHGAAYTAAADGYLENDTRAAEALDDTL